MSYSVVGPVSELPGDFYQQPDFVGPDMYNGDSQSMIDTPSDGEAGPVSSTLHPADAGNKELHDSHATIITLVKDIMQQATKYAAEQAAVNLNPAQPTNSGNDIAGLRQQIKANALALLPHLKPWLGMYSLPANVDILIEYIEPVPGLGPHNNIQASVVYDTVQMTKQKLLKGGPASTSMGALEGALDVSMHLLAHMPKVNDCANLEDRSPTAREFVLPAGGSYYFERPPLSPIESVDQLWWGCDQYLMPGALMPPNKIVLDRFAPATHNNFGAGPAQAFATHAPAGFILHDAPAPRGQCGNRVEQLRSPTPQEKRATKGVTSVRPKSPKAQVKGPNVKIDFNAVKKGTTVPNGPSRAHQPSTVELDHGTYGMIAQPNPIYPAGPVFQPTVASIHEKHAANVANLDNRNGSFLTLQPDGFVHGLNTAFPPSQVQMLNSAFGYGQNGLDGLNVYNNY